MEELNLQETLGRQLLAQQKAGWMQEAEETAQLWDLVCSVLDQVEIITFNVQINPFSSVDLFPEALQPHPHPLGPLIVLL